MNDIQDISWKRVINRYFLKVLSKFLILTAIMLVVFIPIYHETMRSIKNTSIYTLEKDLESSFREVDQKIVDLVQQAQVIARESSISSVTGTANIENRFPQYCYSLSQAKKYIGNYSLESGFVVNAYMLSRYNPIFLSSSIANFDRSLIYGNFYEIEGYSEEEWSSSILDGRTSYFFLPQSNANKTFDPSQINHKEKILHLVVPVINSGSQSQKAFVYMLSIDALFSALTLDRFSDNGFIYLTDQEGQIIASYQYDGEALSPAERLSYLEYKGESMAIIQSHSPDTGLSVVLGVSDSYFASQLFPTQRAIMLMGLFVLIAALIASVLMSYQQSRPMSRAVQTLHRVNPEGASHDAYDYITSTVHELDTQRRYYEQEAQMMGVLMRSSFLDRLLNGKILTREDTERCQRTLDLQDGQYLCINTKIWDSEPSDELEAPLDLTARLNESFRQQLETAGYRVLCHNAEPLITTFLLCLDKNGTFDMESLQKSLEECVQQFQDASGWMVGVGIGRVVTTLESIGWSSRCARNACRMSSLDEPVQIFNRKESRPALVFSFHKAQKLAELVNAGDGQDVADFLEGLASSFPVSRTLTEDEVYQIYYGLKNILQDEARSILSPDEEFSIPEFDTNLNVRDQILAFVEPFIHLCSRMQSRQSAETIQKNHEILHYIQENYTQSTLCALSIADHFGVAEKYVFSVVKSCTGKSLGDYVEVLRLKKAEELLLSHMDINEIPGQIGYNSINTFYKAFKRVYDTSPGKWRASKQSRENTPPYLS